MEKNLLFNSLLSHTQAIVFFKDLDGKYIAVNDYWVTHCKASKDFPIGKTDLDIFAPEIAMKFMENDAIVRETKQILETDEVLIVDGDALIYFARKFPLFDARGKLIGTGGIAVDVTCKRRMEEAIKEKEDQLILITKIISDHKQKLKAITGILPICSNCSKIRDSGGHWHELDQYLRNHSGAQCSHSICPNCAHTLYPELDLGAYSI